MATQVLRDATVWLHDVAVHEIGSSVDLTLGLETQDCTTFGVAGVAAQARKYAGGLFTAELSADGYADMTGYDASLWTPYRARTPIVASVSADSTAGSTAYSFEALERDLTPLSGSVGDMAAVSVTATTRGLYGAIRGTILHPLTARGSSASVTALQLGAVSATQRVFGALHVTAASGTTPSLTVNVQSDDNSGMSSPTTRASFTATDTTTSELVSAAGAITDDWWRVNWTISGSSPSFTFIAIIGIA